MRNNIVSLEKSISSLFMISTKKINVESIFALNFAQILTLITVRFLKKSNIISDLFSTK